MAGKEQELHSWKLTPEQVFVRTNSIIFTPEGQIMFGIYVKARVVESLVESLSDDSGPRKDRLIREISEEYHQLKFSESPSSFPEFIKKFVDIVQKRATYVKLNGQISGKWSILPRKKQSLLTKVLELLEW